MNTLLTVSEVAEKLHLSKWSLYQMTRRNLIPFYRIGGAIRISEAQIQEIMEQNLEPVNKKSSRE